jgi:hypothetical protein
MSTTDVQQGFLQHQEDSGLNTYFKKCIVQVAQEFKAKGKPFCQQDVWSDKRFKHPKHGKPLKANNLTMPFRELEIEGIIYQQEERIVRNFGDGDSTVNGYHYEPDQEMRKQRNAQRRIIEEGKARMKAQQGRST